MSLNRRAQIGSAALMAGLTLAACGGSPSSASVEDFCATWTDSRGGTLEEVRDSADRLADVGTPEEADGAARAGFEVFVDALASIDQEAFDALEQVAADDTSLAEIYGISEDDAGDVVTFFDYANTTCAETDG